MPPKARKRAQPESRRTSQFEGPPQPKRARRKMAEDKRKGEDEPPFESEDPVTFLKRMQDNSPNTLSMLNAKQARLLSKSSTAPYEKEDVNEEYLTDLAAYVGTKHMVETAKRQLRDSLLTPQNKTEELDVQTFEKQTKTLEKIVDRMKWMVDCRLKVTEEQKGELALPRIIRLCRKFKFTENESRIAIFSLVAQSGYDRENRFGYGGADVISTCQFLEIPLQDMLDFLDQDRPHMQQGFFPEVQPSYIFNCQVNYDPDYCKALMGSQLRSSEFLKLEQTLLADVIAEEPGNEHYRDENLGLKMGASPTNLPPGEGGKGGEGEEGGEEGGAMEPITTAEPPPEDVPQGPDAVEGEGMEEKAEEEGEGEGGGEEKEESDEDISDLDALLRKERAREKKRKSQTEAEPEPDVDEDPDRIKPYKTDLDYLDDHFQLIAFKLKVKGMDSRIEMEANYDDGRRDQRYQRQKREAESKAKVQEKKCNKRLALTRQAGSWVPRLERMVESRNLSMFEKNVILALIGGVIQPNKFQHYEVRISSNYCQVGDLLRVFCDSLEDQILHRKFFYKSATMVHEGMILVHNSGITGDPTMATVEIDRRMLDFCVGLDTEFSEIVEGSHLYFPKTKFDQVILSKDQKELILNTVSNFEGYKRCRRKMGLDDAITYGAGMVMLFHGAPGTGKTMMANALANKLQKKVLLINFPSLGSMSAGENFKFIFREAKINDAILFFDECEAIFESREKGTHQVNLLLTEIERHDGLIIMATNRPYDLDEAMHRRIMIAIEFRQPDHLLRKAIWESHIPEQMSLADDIDLTELSLRFELSGGFIKNAILSALSIAVSRDGENPVVCHKDLQQGANLQLRGALRMKDFDRRVVPEAGLDEVVVEDKIMKQLKEIVQFEKARSVLFGQWGFARRNHQGLTVLLHGPPGTGKTLVAEAVGFEVGKPLKVINCGELLSKWVGESTKNINAIFQEARHQDAILVFDEAEGLFGSRTSMSTSTDRYANVDVGVLLYHIERFPGIIILTTNLIDNIDKAFFRRLRFVLHFETPPTKLRAKLWRLLVPEETPLDKEVDFDRLARHEMTGGNIKSAIFRAASRAALRGEDKRQVTMEDLEDAAEDEVGKESTRTSFRRQDSDAARMYN